MLIFELSSIWESTADEVFYRNQALLAMVDSSSRFHAMLEKEEHRDADSWVVHLMDSIDIEGFNSWLKLSVVKIKPILSIQHNLAVALQATCA